MSSKKSIDDKQLIRSIADVVVYNPHFARDMFSSTNDIVHIFPELNQISDFVLSFTTNEQYYRQLRDVIIMINDNETRAIFQSSLNSYLLSNNHDEQASYSRMAAG
ncbi:hypothetical protein [Vibrio vulnificus]|uniref:hypothetical protein n=1 Tax=Vibrio vulnificus TaxID=672 RepID=UPI001CDB5316|nr:hypothetical protein [Vibrio vulnificus]MCA3910727.1 hypothetical protein [Vibrio vulnificus]